MHVLRLIERECNVTNTRMLLQDPVVLGGMARSMGFRHVAIKLTLFASPLPPWVAS